MKSINSSRNVRVIKAACGWRLEGRPTQTVVFKSKHEAVTAAKAMFAMQGGQINVYKNGRVDAYITVIGAARARRINAVEGVTPDQVTRQLLRNVARLSEDEQRKQVLMHFRNRAFA